MNNKIITADQIERVMGTFLGTNITAKDYLVVQKFFAELQDAKEENKEELEAKKK